VATEVEHGQGDEGVRRSEPEGHPGDEPDLGVDRLDQPVGHAVLDCCEDLFAVLDDAGLELDE
jgi:hypothetical protein